MRPETLRPERPKVQQRRYIKCKGCGFMKRLTAVLLFCLVFLTPVQAESPEEREIQPQGYIALTFDDGPSGELTQRLLDGLRARNARATFFLCGYRMDEYPAILSRYIPEGHEVAVHSTVHTDLTKLSREEVSRDMQETAQKIADMLGVRPKLMRPPGGAYNDLVVQEAKEQGLSVILWSVDPRDWATHNAARVMETMAKQAGDGDVVLMHDLSDSSVAAALRLVDALQSRGYEFVTVSELACLKGKGLEPGAVYKEF